MSQFEFPLGDYIETEVDGTPTFYNALLSASGKWDVVVWGGRATSIAEIIQEKLSEPDRDFQRVLLQRADSLLDAEVLAQQAVRSWKIRTV